MQTGEYFAYQRGILKPIPVSRGEAITWTDSRKGGSGIPDESKSNWLKIHTAAKNPIEKFLTL